MSTKLLFCLDYDKTYDADPGLWNNFIQSVQNSGHRVILATYRDDRFDKTPLLEEVSKTIPVYFTRGVAKKWWLEQFAPEENGRPDIWIDDRPEAILNNSGLNREGLAEWRKEQTANS